MAGESSSDLQDGTGSWIRPMGMGRRIRRNVTHLSRRRGVLSEPVVLVLSSGSHVVRRAGLGRGRGAVRTSLPPGLYSKA